MTETRLSNSSRVISMENGGETSFGKSEGNSTASRTRLPRTASQGSNRRIVVKDMEITSSEDEEEDEETEEPSPNKVENVTAKNNAGNKKGIKVTLKEMELTSSEEDSDFNTKSRDLSPNSSRAQSPSVPEGQYEIEDVVDYVRDQGNGDMYLIKWHNWESEFNTWEPPANLVNCDEVLLKFYNKRKNEAARILRESDYVETSNGKRRRKGPPILDVPPDPRPLAVRLQEFFECTVPLTEEEIMGKYPEWNKKFILSKGKYKGNRWPMAKVNKFLQDGVDGKLTKEQIVDFRKELVFLEIIQRRIELTDALKQWQLKINDITQGRPFITVENEYDFEGPPEGFEFVNDYVPSAGIIIPSDPPVGCTCGDGCYENRSVCCAKQFGSQFAYTKFRKVAVPVGTPIYECNRKCKCGPDCPNRVVQDGKTDVKLSIFRTANGCGWGVKTLKSIKKGCFITLYVGEVITNDEADIRGKMDGDGHTYLFDLDFDDKDNHPYSVDASKFGNVAHFINHSCNPNLGVYNVWVDCLDPNLPKLAMFAARDIAKGEELSFDYLNQPDEYKKPESTKSGSEQNETPASIMKARKKCLCGVSNCKKLLFI